MALLYQILGHICGLHFMMTLDTFAVTAYRKPEVADACLTLQQELGLDVPVLLFCAWYASTRGELDDKLLAQVIETSRPFSLHVVQPLRQVRRWMKQPADSQNTIMMAANKEAWQSLRETIKSIEISAELLWLDALQSLTESQALRAKNTNLSQYKVMENMHRYCQTFKSAAERDAINVHALLSRIAEAGQQLCREQIGRSLQP
jgi:uncharacterized protein (TIGR02444 family)